VAISKIAVMIGLIAMSSCATCIRTEGETKMDWASLGDLPLPVTTHNIIRGLGDREALHLCGGVKPA